MGRSSVLALLLSLSGACNEVEEASLGTLTVDARIDVTDAEQLGTEDTQGSPHDASAAPPDATPADAATPSIAADAASDAGATDASASSDASIPHDGGGDASEAGAHDAGHEAGRTSLECRLEPWECR